MPAPHTPSCNISSILSSSNPFGLSFALQRYILSRKTHKKATYKKLTIYISLNINNEYCVKKWMPAKQASIKPDNRKRWEAMATAIQASE